MQVPDQFASGHLVDRPEVAGLTPAELWDRLAAGASAFRYEYCISLLFFTLRCQSRVHLVTLPEARYVRGVPYTLLSLVLGWWGVPWGPVLTLRAWWVNSCGGIDVTDELVAWLDSVNPTAVFPENGSPD